MDVHLPSVTWVRRCGAEAALHSWTALPAVAQALHVKAGPHKFDYFIASMDLSPLYTSLSQRSDLRFVIYNGQSGEDSRPPPSLVVRVRR